MTPKRPVTKRSGAIAAEHVTNPPAARKRAPVNEAHTLEFIGHLIAGRFPLGSASRWHKTAQSQAEKRISEAIAGIVGEASDDDALARRVAISAARFAVGFGAPPPRAYVLAAFGHAAAEIDRELSGVAERLAAVRATRTRKALAEISAKRKPILAEARHLTREITRLRANIARGLAGIDGPAGVYAARWCQKRDLPRLERRLTKLRAAAPAYQLSPAKRRSLAELTDRMRRLRRARQSLAAAQRNLSCPVRAAA